MCQHSVKQKVELKAVNKTKLLVPVKNEDYIIPVKAAGADIIYTDYKYFLKDKKLNKARLVKFIKVAHSVDLQLYIYFDHCVYENELAIIKNTIDDLTSINVDGIMVNDFSVLDLIKHKKMKPLKFDIHLDSGLNIHNIASYELLKPWKPKSVNITEEIYLKNVSRIRKYTGGNVCITINEVIWLLNYAIAWGIDLFKLSGNYDDINRLTELILLLKEIIQDIHQGIGMDNLKIEKVTKLFDHSEPKRHYQVDHFTRTFKTISGNDFDFAGNIKLFNWNINEVVLKNYCNEYNYDQNLPKLRVKLTRFDHLQAIEDFLRDYPDHKIDIIEYGEIIDPSDLAQYNYNDIINKVKSTCRKLNIGLYITTPKILIERDFETVLETIKFLCFKDPRPQGLVVNNIGLWKKIAKNSKFNDIKLELGPALDIYNSKVANIYHKLANVDGVNLPNTLTVEEVKSTTENLNVKEKSFNVLGSLQLITSGLCPLNNDIAVVSRLQCKAPCQKSSYAVVDPANYEMFPMALDGFCRLHLVYSYVYDRLSDLNILHEAGLNNFIIDFTALPAEMIPSLLERYFSAISNPEDYKPIERTVVSYQPKVYTHTKIN